LVEDILSKSIAMEPIRKGFGRGLLEAGKLDQNVVAACADLTDSTQMNLFKEAFPDRFVEIGVAEQNLVTVGSGLAAMGKIPFVSSYAAFSPGRNWEQIRTTICLNDQPVKIVGSHAGVNDQNVNELVRGGVDVLNVGGFIQNSKEPQTAYRKLATLVA
jgi:transketolase